ALPSQGGTIVLVSDGIDTCAPPPVCEVAADLADRGVDIVINTVGFNVDAAARAELQCIADAAGGTYADATDADTLADELKKATTRTYRAYESDLEHIAGGATDSEATDLPGDVTAFRTTLAAPPEGRAASSESFFRAPVAEGERLVVSVQTFQEPQLGGIGRGDMVITPSLTGSDGQDCRLDFDLAAAASVSGVQTATVYSHVIGENCNTDSLTLELDRRGNWKSGEDVDVEVTVTRFGPADLSDTPDPATELGAVPPIDSPSADAPEITPGVWFDDAAELTPGETVAAEIVPGETHFFRVPLEYGQQLAAVIEPVAESSDFDDVRVGEHLAYTAYNEARAEVPLTRSNTFIGVQRPEDTGYAAPVLFSNRYGGTDGEGSPEATVEKLWLDGDQYFTVTYEKTFSQEEIDAQTQLPTLTYHLVTDVVGDPVPGPTFAETAATGTAPSSTSEETEPTTDAEPATAAGEDTGTSTGLWLGLGALALVILGAAGFALTRRK
ncbi:MAG TPA: hypothetical protein K8V93_11580, partial [Corynebacterium pollutisoli]|nr:hypothetical protein [Corynebacterium pollutisoli]